MELCSHGRPESFYDQWEWLIDARTSEEHRCCERSVAGRHFEHISNWFPRSACSKPSADRSRSVYRWSGCGYGDQPDDNDWHVYRTQRQDNLNRRVGFGKHPNLHDLWTM